MKLKLTLSQLEALELYLRVSINNHGVGNMTLELIREIAIKFYDKVQSKIKKVHRSSKIGTGMTLKKEEAYALYLWYNNISEYLKQEYTYEDLVLNQICLSIHKEFN